VGWGWSRSAGPGPGAQVAGHHVRAIPICLFLSGYFEENPKLIRVEVRTHGASRIQASFSQSSLEGGGLRNSLSYQRPHEQAAVKAKSNSS